MKFAWKMHRCTQFKIIQIFSFFIFINHLFFYIYFNVFINCTHFFQLHCFLLCTHITFKMQNVNCKHTHTRTYAHIPHLKKYPFAINQKKKTKKYNRGTKKKQGNEEAPIDQPRRLSLRRPSFKREVVENESFIDIQLKPVTKDKATPQKAQQVESNLTKVNSEYEPVYFSLSIINIKWLIDCDVFCCEIDTFLSVLNAIFYLSKWFLSI